MIESGVHLVGKEVFQAKGRTNADYDWSGSILNMFQEPHGVAGTQWIGERDWRSEVREGPSVYIGQVFIGYILFWVKWETVGEFWAVKSHYLIFLEIFKLLLERRLKEDICGNKEVQWLWSGWPRCEVLVAYTRLLAEKGETHEFGI